MLLLLFYNNFALMLAIIETYLNTNIFTKPFLLQFITTLEGDDDTLNTRVAGNSAIVLSRTFTEEEMIMVRYHSTDIIHESCVCYSFSFSIFQTLTKESLVATRKFKRVQS